MILFLKSIENKSYIFSRFISVLIKPFLLLICLVFDYKEFGTVITMVFLVSSVNMMLSSIPIYRNFFISTNNKIDYKKKYFSKKYKSEIVILFLISLTLIIPINLFFDNKMETYLCSALIFSIDKVHDEIQRFLILKKKFNTWSFITNIKNLTLLIFIFNPLFNINMLFLAFVYFIINFLIQSKFINLNFNSDIKKNIKKFSLSVWKNKNIFLISYFLIFYNLGDKIIIGKLFKANVTEYIFLSNILSLPLLFIFYFYISKYRSEFVNNLFDLKDIFLSRKFNYLLISTFLVVIIFVVIYYYLNLSNFSPKVIIFLFMFYILRSYSLILNEVVYWKKFYGEFLFFEFIFFILFIFLFLTTNYFNVSLEYFLLTFFLLFLVKFILKLNIYLKK